MVTRVPPAVAPCRGAIDVIAGSGGGSTVIVAVAWLVAPLLSVTVSITVVTPTG